jgi:hypothetical protein
MQDEFFSRLVAEEVKGRVNAGQSDYLRLPENWSRWQRALVALVDNLNNQLAHLSNEEAEETQRYKQMGEDGLRLLAEKSAEYEQRKKKIARFKFHVEARLDEVSKMIALGTDQLDEKFEAIDFLRKAIEKHRSLMADHNLEETPIDKALWAALDGKWQFESITEADFV